MTNQGRKLITELEAHLTQIVKVYRALLSVVRKEKEILISANIDDLDANNKAKEKMLLEIQSLEKKRLELVDKVIAQESLEPGEVTLLSLATLSGGDMGERLRSLHSVLDLLVKRVKELNLRNEELIHSALENITGAIGSIRDTLNENKTYEKKGKVDDKKPQQT